MTGVSKDSDMNVPGTLVISVLADPAPDLLSRLTEALARLDLLPHHVYARLRADEGVAPSAPAAVDADRPQVMEVDFHLHPDSDNRRDRLVHLFRRVIGVRGVVCSA